jgi:Tfp pilus assembly protein PilW
MEVLQELTLIEILVLVAFSMLIIFTGGVLYLTVAEWRDRRRREDEKRQR